MDRLASYFGLGADKDRQEDQIAQQVYLNNYPYQGLYTIVCNSSKETRCSNACEEVFQDDDILYKNRLESKMESIPDDCQFDVLHRFDNVPTLSTSRTFEIAAIAIEPSFFPLLDDLSELVELSFRIFYEHATDQELQSNASTSKSLGDNRSVKWAFGLWTSLPSGTGQCGSIIQTGSGEKVGAEGSCRTNDLNSDTIFSLADCQPSGTRTLLYQSYHLTDLSLAAYNFGRTEDVIAWNRAGSPEPACVSIVDSHIGLAASTTLTGSANVFIINGGPAAQLLPRHTRDVNLCEKCIAAGYHWCSIKVPLPRDHHAFDPDVPENQTSSTYTFPPGGSCYINPLMCPGSITTCEGSVASLPGYTNSSPPYLHQHPLILIILCFILLLR